MNHYSSLHELQQAYASGALSATAHRLILDNDHSYLYVGEEPVYRGPGPEVLLREALDLLGIPWGNA